MEEQMIQQEQIPMEEGAAAELARRVREEVARARAEWEAAAARADAERDKLAAMSDDERARYNLSRREAALAEREKLLVERELRAVVFERLAERGLPRELADALPYDSEQHCLAALDALESVFRQAVQSAVDLRLRGKAPAAPARHEDAMSDEEYYRARG